MRQGGLNLQGRRWALLLRSGARCGDWGSLRGLGCIAGAVDVVEVVVGGEGEVLSTGPGACVICMLPWALVQQNSCQAGVVHICAEWGGGRHYQMRNKPGLYFSPQEPVLLAPH